MIVYNYTWHTGMNLAPTRVERRHLEWVDSVTGKTKAEMLPKYRQERCDDSDV